MNLDKYGLPCQVDGDCNDQLQRVGMIAVGNRLTAPVDTLKIPGLVTALISNLQPGLGVYSRYTNATSLDVTADQLIPAVAYWALEGVISESFYMFFRMVSRLGFAQNVRKNGDLTKVTIPDFMLLRALPLFLRTSVLFYPLALVVDVLLVFAAIAAIFPTSMDTVDDNNIIITLIVCKAKMVTPLSSLAANIYYTLRPNNYGVTVLGAKNPVAGALMWYHAAKTGGNPEVAELYLPLVDQYLAK